MNKIKIRIVNVHYATITESDGVITYGKPKSYQRRG